MMSYRFNIFLFVLFTLIIDGCRTLDQSNCETSEIVESDACYQRDQLISENYEHENFFVKSDDIQQQQSWFSMLYDSVINTVDSLTENLVKDIKKPEVSEHQKTEDMTFKEESLDEIVNAAKDMASELFADDDPNKELFQNVLKEMQLAEEETVYKDDKAVYEYTPVHRIDPGNVGDVQYIELEEGKTTKLITRAVRPPLFEIPDFISDEDCDYIIEKTREKGLNVSSMFGSKTEKDSGKRFGSHRKSFSSSLKLENVGEEFMSRLHDKVSKLIGMPKQVVQWSENLAIGMYEPGGHYHAHLDSNEASREIPCCFQKECHDSKGVKGDFIECCRICRYVTVLYYLNDVEEGGETAFPLADLSYGEMVSKENTNWRNLTSDCHDAAVVIKPKKGKAIMWYNHLVDKKGYISFVEKRSYHGGCEVTKGTKWIATNWISTPIYAHRFIPSKYRDII